MLAMKCSYCGSDDHPWFNCRKKPEGWKPPAKPSASPLEQDLDILLAMPATKSTAARKDVHSTVRMTKDGTPQPEAQDRIGASGNDPQVEGLPAGTQAPPVDTPMGAADFAATNPPRLGFATRKDASLAAPKPRGRPRTGFDKKAYDAERMRKAREELRAK